MVAVLSESLQLDDSRRKRGLSEDRETFEPNQPSLTRDNMGVPGSVISKPGEYSSSPLPNGAQYLHSVIVSDAVSGGKAAGFGTGTGFSLAQFLFSLLVRMGVYVFEQ
uniref:Uncharacterized protein n=1 Tax=Glossina pallidipes TaxID=7398 RepID=A0A1A9Z3C7_GLOPL